MEYHSPFSEVVHVAVLDMITDYVLSSRLQKMPRLS
jgi:hypothetical protein